MRAALEMQAAMGELSKSWAAAGRATLQIHIGINSGHVAVGNIESETYLQYTAIGDTTNLASRICDITQPGEILLSASAKARLSGLALTPLTPRKVKGKYELVELFRVES